MTKSVRGRSRRDALEFIQSMTRELRDMAHGLRDEQLTYFLEMAYFEVSDKIRALACEGQEKSTHPGKAA